MLYIRFYWYIEPKALYKNNIRKVLKMKIAKKVLAVVMALSIIFALSAMAFAKVAPEYEIKMSKVDGYRVATVYLKNGKGVTSDEIKLQYDPNVLKLTAVYKGADVKAFSEVENNTVMGMQKPDAEKIDTANGKNTGYGYLFSEPLGEPELKYAPGSDTKIDINNFELCSFYFKVLDKTATTKIKISSVRYSSSDSKTIHGVAETTTSAPVTTTKPAATTTTQPAETTTKKPATTTTTTETADITTTKDNSGSSTTTTTTAVVEEDTTPAANPATGDKAAGDNMALAAAGAVVALAGVAFVISKKRK